MTSFIWIVKIRSIKSFLSQIGCDRNFHPLRLDDTIAEFIGSHRATAIIIKHFLVGLEKDWEATWIKKFMMVSGWDLPLPLITGLWWLPFHDGTWQCQKNHFAKRRPRRSKRPKNNKKRLYYSNIWHNEKHFSFATKTLTFLRYSNSKCM